MTMHLLRTHLREHLEPWQDTHPILISVPSKVYLLCPDAVEHICFLLGHHTDVQPLIEIHIGSTITELSQQAIPLLASKDVGVAKDDVLLPSPELRQVGNLMAASALLLFNDAE